MDWRLFLDALGGLGGIAAAIALVFGARQFHQQMNAQTFITYTERYERIMNELPLEIRLLRFEPSAAAFGDDPRVQAVFLRYFNMCSEEFYLQSNGYLDQKLWRIWESEIRRTLASPLARAVWARVSSEFSSYSEFQEFVQSARQHSDESSSAQVAV